MRQSEAEAEAEDAPDAVAADVEQALVQMRLDGRNGHQVSQRTQLLVVL